MVSETGLYPRIFRIDVDAARSVFGEELAPGDLPVRIVAEFNKRKNAQIYEPEGTATCDGCALTVYRNARSRPRPSPWVSFYQPSGIEITEVTAQSQHFVGFVVVDDELYAHTGGQSAVVFERFVDVSFPIDVARRIAEPEVKRARSSQISGTTLANDVNFRDPRRITYTESLENVWTALSGQVRPDVLAESDVRAVFGSKPTMRLEVSSSIMFGPRVPTLDKMITLIKWLGAAAERQLPADDVWAILDSIKILNPRKKKDLIGRLRSSLARRLVVDGDYESIAVTHLDASLYANASSYLATRGQDQIYAGERRPELVDLLNGVDPGPAGPEALLNSVVLSSECEDYGPGIGTRGTLQEHLHGEMQLENRTYFLLSGRWYEVNASYVDLVTQDLGTVVGGLDLGASSIGLKPWSKSVSEGDYNINSATGATINGDRVLTNNVELFDLLADIDGRTFIIHVKRDFDVKMRDVRSQIVNAASIIENDLRLADPVRLRRHHATLVARGRTTMSESAFLELMRRPRTYVLAYATETKVEKHNIDQFGSMVARMEVVTLSGQFRQVAGTNHTTRLAIAWIELVK